MKLLKKYFSIFALFTLLAGIFFQASPSSAAGAAMFFTPAAGTYIIGDKFTIAIRAFVGGVNINAAEGVINFDNSKLEVASVSESGSIFSMWVVRPTFSNPKGTVSFGGGVRPPGFSGQSGKVLSVTFKAKSVGVANVRFTSGAILANDSKGSNILESMGSANFTIAAKELAVVATTSDIANATQATVQANIKNALSVVPIEKLESNTPTTDEYLKPVIVSITNPDQNLWTPQNRIEFKWSLPQEARDVAVAFNKNLEADSSVKSVGLLAGKTYENVADGIWYMHVKYNDGKRWGVESRYRVLVDSNRPTPFQIEVKQADPNTFPRLYFKASDNVSGIDHYDVFVNSLEERQFEVAEDEEQPMLDVQLANLEYGEHMAMIKVIDKAGNETLATAQFKVEPIETPIIKNFSKELKSEDKFFASGNALPDIRINLYIQDEYNQVKVRNIQSDANGNWFYLSTDNFKNGRYIAWIEAENVNGLKSMPSEKVSFLVTPPVFAVIGSVVVNYFTVLVSLIFMIILIVIAGIYLVGLIRKKLKKETIEVEVVLEEKMTELQVIIDKEVAKFAKLTKQPEVIKESKKMRTILSDQVELTRKKIVKEIKDVEAILK